MDAVGWTGDDRTTGVEELDIHTLDKNGVLLGELP